MILECRPVELGVLAFSMILVLAACGNQDPSIDTVEPQSLGANTTLSTVSLLIGGKEIELQPEEENYAFDVANGVSSITASHSTTSTLTSIKVNNVAVASGEASPAIALEIGANPISVEVTAQDGLTVKNYSIVITRLNTDLFDPTPGAFDTFGEHTLVLDSGNIVVTDPNDSSVASRNGAAHLYDSLTRELISSFYGDQRHDRLGSNGITALGNGNYVITSPSDNVEGISSAGSVRLFNGTTGAQIGTPVVGNGATDSIGIQGITVLSSNNYVINSSSDDVDGVKDAGSVQLVNGNTGAQIGSAITGLGYVWITEWGKGNYVAGATIGRIEGVNRSGSVVIVDGTTGAQTGTAILGLGSAGSRELSNGNFIIVGQHDKKEGALYLAGSVRLMDGTTGSQIGSTIEGNQEYAGLGDGGIYILSNGNYIIATKYKFFNGVFDPGSAQLINGETGAQISFVEGYFNQPGIPSIRVLGNGNFVIASPQDDVGGVEAAGSVRLIDGETGAQIGIIAGDRRRDRVGFLGITVLGNGNFVIASPQDDVGGVADAGSVRLVDGTTGTQIGMVAGVRTNERMGATHLWEYDSAVKALNNHNYVVISQDGSVRLVDGTTGVQIGSAFVAHDLVDYTIQALSNSNYVIAFPNQNVGGVSRAGLVRLVDGTTGAQIGTAIVGAHVGDRLGSGRAHDPNIYSIEKYNGIIGLDNSNYVITSSNDNVGGEDAGSVRLVDGSTGEQISMIKGDQDKGFWDAVNVSVVSNSNYMITTPEYDVDGVTDAGSIWIVDGDTGVTHGNVVGRASNDVESSNIATPADGSYFVLAAPKLDNSGGEDSGLVRIIAGR